MENVQAQKMGRSPAKTWDRTNKNSAWDASNKKIETLTGNAESNGTQG